MFRDERRNKVWNEIRQHGLRSFTGQLTPEVFAQAATTAGVSVGCSALNLVNLVWLGIGTAMHRGQSFAFVLMTTLRLLEDQEAFSATPLGKEKQRAKRRGGRKGKSKHDPYRHDPTELTEEAFAQARRRMPLAFWMALVLILAQRFQRDHSQHVNYRGFRLLAIDGTSLTLPDVARLRAHYGTPKNGARRRAVPQARVVMLLLPGTRIPIAYEVSPLCDSELTLAARLMRHLQANDLLLMDRGFISYGMFWEIQNRQAFFGTRLKKGLQFKKIKQLGPKDCLVEWTPRDSRRQWKHLPGSIRLRVIRYQFPGFRASGIITNVLDCQRLSREDWVRVAYECDDNGKLTPGLYHRRWEIETSYFELKVVLDAKSLRSRTPASVEFELAGRMVYYLLVRWLIVLAAERHGLDPSRISFTDAVRELEQMRPSLTTSSLRWVTRTLLPRLLDRIASHLVPLRPGRHYPRPKDSKPKSRKKKKKATTPKPTRRSNTKRNPRIQKR